MHRMKWFVAALIVVAAVLVVAAPAMATADSRTPTGPQIRFSGPTTFAANTPFHIGHGFSCAVADGACIASEIAHGNFSLYVDGVLQPSTKIVDNQDGFLSVVWLTNFPNGLPAGDHTLDGVWTVNGTVVQTGDITITFS